MSWIPIQDSEGWELNEETQEFRRVDGEVFEGGSALAEMLTKVWGFQVTPAEATRLYLNFLNKIPPGSGKSAL